MGAVWEEAYRIQSRRLALTDALGPGVVAVGPFWREGADPCEIDAVVLAGRRREAVLVGEAKWARRVDGRRIRRRLEACQAALPAVADGVRLSGAREAVTGEDGPLVVTAAGIFAGWSPEPAVRRHLEVAHRWRPPAVGPAT